MNEGVTLGEWAWHEMVLLAKGVNVRRWRAREGSGRLRWSAISRHGGSLQLRGVGGEMGMANARVISCCCCTLSFDGLTILPLFGKKTYKGENKIWAIYTNTLYVVLLLQIAPQCFKTVILVL